MHCRSWDRRHRSSARRPLRARTACPVWIGALVSSVRHRTLSTMNADAAAERTWRDLTANVPGVGISHEAARRRQSEGPGADRSWRVGADGEFAIAQILAQLTTARGLARLRRRTPRWRVLHSVPIGTRGRDIDHVLIGPPGVVVINTKHHRGGRLILDGDTVTVNGRRTAYIAAARQEAVASTQLLTAALTEAGAGALAARLPVRPVIAVVGGVLHADTGPRGSAWPPRPR
jgi:hypothetical protein